LSDGIRKQLSQAASVVALPAALTRNVNRATEAIVDIRDQLATLVDLPREVLDQLRAMEALAEEMNRTAQELRAIAEPMLHTAQGIHDLAQPMLDTGRAATRAAEQARDSVERTNQLIEQSLELAAPIQGITARAASLRDRLRGDRPPGEPPQGT